MQASSVVLRLIATAVCVKLTTNLHIKGGWCALGHKVMPSRPRTVLSTQLSHRHNILQPHTPATTSRLTPIANKMFKIFTTSGKSSHQRSKDVWFYLKTGNQKNQHRNNTTIVMKSEISTVYSLCRRFPRPPGPRPRAGGCPGTAW